MNAKEIEFNRIVNNSIACCAMLEEGLNISYEDVFGKGRGENVSMIRCLVSSQVIAAGFTVTTLAKKMKRTPQSIRHLLDKAYYLSKTSRAYKIAEKEATELNKPLYI